MGESKGIAAHLLSPPVARGRRGGELIDRMEVVHVPGGVCVCVMFPHSISLFAIMACVHMLLQLNL